MISEVIRKEKSRVDQCGVSNTTNKTFFCFPDAYLRDNCELVRDKLCIGRTQQSCACHVALCLYVSHSVNVLVLCLKVCLCEPGLTLLAERFSLICLGDSAEDSF